MTAAAVLFMLLELPAMLLLLSATAEFSAGSTTAANDDGVVLVSITVVSTADDSVNVVVA
jgi:hypothetical protein